MDCIAKKHAEMCVNKLWSEIDENIKEILMELVNKDYLKWTKEEGILTFGDMPLEIKARLEVIEKDIVAIPYETSKITLKNNLDEYYYQIINNIDDYYSFEEYTFVGVKTFTKFLIDNLDAEQVLSLYDNTEEQLELRFCNIIDNMKEDDEQYFKLGWLDTYNSKETKIKFRVNRNQIIF